MTKHPYARRLLAVILSAALLMSCVVWTGISAAGTVYTCDFTGYAVTAASDVDGYKGSIAQLVDTGEAAHGQAMQLTYTAGATTGKAGFRFFADTDTRVSLSKPNLAKVEFTYKVEKLNGTAELRVLGGSINWTQESFTSNQAVGSENHVLAATLSPTATPGTWQRASVIVGSDRSSGGIHIYLQAANAANEAGSSVLIDDIKVIRNYVPVNVTFDYGYDSKTETVTGDTGEAVTFPAEPTRPCYIFKGWNTEADGTGDTVTTAVFGENVTYYAVWEPDPTLSGITFVTNGGEAVAPMYGTIGTAVTLPTPVRGAYVFEGWYTDAALTTPATPAYPATAGQIDTLYAKWDVPPPTASVTPGGVLLGVQTFETGTLADFTTLTNNTGKFDGIVTEENMTSGGSKSLKTTVKDMWNAQRGRPRIVIKLGDATSASNLVVKEGGSYAVSFWVRAAARDTSFAFYAATMGTSDLDTMINKTSKTGGDCHTLQTITATVGGNNVTLSSNKNEVIGSTLEADQWTQVIVTIPSLTLDAAGEDNVLAIGFTSNASSSSDSWNDTAYYIDDIAVYETRVVRFDTAGGEAIDPIPCDTDGKVTLPEPSRFGYRSTGWYTDPACTPASRVTSPYTPTGDSVTLYAGWEADPPVEVSLKQDFEAATSVEDFSTNTKKPFVLVTDQNHTPSGTQALRTTVKQGWGYNFGRPLWAFQMNGDTAPLEIVPNMPATVTFSLMATRDVSTVSFSLNTVSDLAVLERNPYNSASADSIRTMQVLSSCTVGTPLKGGIPTSWGVGNEVGRISLKAGEWITVTAEIASLTAHGTGTQYLVLGLGDPTALNEIEPYDLYVDDISIDTYVGGHLSTVSYNTMGGDKLEDSVNAVWTAITAEATREGYEFDGWYADEACTVPVTVYPPVETVTLYAGWRPLGAEVMTFEIDPDFTPQVYMDMDLDDTAVQNYYSGLTTIAKVTAASHALVDDAAAGKVIKASYNTAADTASALYGFRLVDKNATADGYTLEKGKSYSLSFRYKVEALPVTTTVSLLEGTVNWSGPTVTSRVDHTGFTVTAADVGAGWKQGRISFVAELDGEGIHLVLDAADYTKRSGTVVYFDDIRLETYQLTSFTTAGDAARVEGEKNVTAGGKAALKLSTARVDVADTARVVYANSIGNRLFKTDRIHIATAWLYADRDTTATLMAISDPDLTKMAAVSDEHLLGQKTVSLKAGTWTRVQMEYGLAPIDGAAASYVSLAVSTDNAAVMYMDDISVGIYENDPTKTQTYEELPAGTSPNAPYLNGALHGYYGNTVVSGIGYGGSAQSLQITMQSDVQEDISRAVLFLDKMDATAAVNAGYMVTFYAMVAEDTDVTFTLGTSDTIDVSDRVEQATAMERDAATTLSLKAGEWQPVSIAVADLQGKNPEMCPAPYITLGAWFEGAAADNTRAVYIDNVRFGGYEAPTVAKEAVLCFENTGAFGFGKQLSLNKNGSMEVVLEQNYTTHGYYALKVTSEGANGIGGATRPQFNLVNANNEPVRVETGKDYKVTFWLYMPEDAPSATVRFWLAVTDKTDSYNNSTNNQRKEEQVYETSSVAGTPGAWKRVTVSLEDLPREGYLRLGICGTSNSKTVFYLDDIRVDEQKVFTLTGEETVQDFEKYNLEENSFIRYADGAVSDDINHTEGGSKSLRLVGRGNSGFGRNQMILMDPATQQPYEFRIGEIYTLSFWLYSPEEQSSTFTLNAWLWGTDDPAEALTSREEKNDKNDLFEYDGNWTPVSNDGSYVAGEWNQYSLTFTAANGKYMLMGMTDGKRANGGYVYYVDDIEIVIPEPALITYDPNGGAFADSMQTVLNDKGQYVENGRVGLRAVGPESDPIREGKRFMGWALDPEGQNAFSLLADVIPSTTLTLYAMWGDWETEDSYDKIDTSGKDDLGYRTEIRYEQVWVGNDTIPTLDFHDDFHPEDADPVINTPADPTPDPVSDGLPVWLIILIIAAAVVIVGGGAVLTMLLLKSKSTDEKEVA